MKPEHIAVVCLFTAIGASSASAGDFFGWHAANHYGTFDGSPQDVWEDMTEDVYGDDELEDVFHDPCDLFHLGQGYWACPGCRYAPLRYAEVRGHVLTPQTPYVGASWYRGIPVGHREKMPLAGDEAKYDP